MSQTRRQKLVVEAEKKKFLRRRESNSSLVQHSTLLPSIMSPHASTTRSRKSGSVLMGSSEQGSHLRSIHKLRNLLHFQQDSLVTELFHAKCQDLQLTA